MDNFYLSALVLELAPEVQGRTVARVSQESSTLVIDLRLSEDRLLLASLDRASPALYLSNEFASQLSAKRRAPTAFISLARKHLIGATLVQVQKEPDDRIVQLVFETLDAGDNKIPLSLRLLLTGRSANAYLIDSSGSVLSSFYPDKDGSKSEPPSPLLETDFKTITRDLSDSMTEVDVIERFFGPQSKFSPQLKNEFLARSGETSPAQALRSLIEDLVDKDPVPLVYSRVSLVEARSTLIDPRKDLLLSHIELAQASGMLRHQASSLSEAADKYYSTRAAALLLRSEYMGLKQVLSREVSKQLSVLNSIEADRSRFANPEKLKRSGDLLLANIANARIQGNQAVVIDYYDPNQTEIHIELPEGATLQEAATSYFERYQKARRALAAIAERQKNVSTKLTPLAELLETLEKERSYDSISLVSKALDKLLGIKSDRQSGKTRNKGGKGGSFGRRFRSTDGYEIVVGRNDRDNDALTFRLAKPNDIWLHAADYPGSHALIRNPNRETPPHRTITEAAELAAFYSQAKREGKAAVHYALKKFVSKPPRSKPGLVRLSSFKTILVEPRCVIERLG